MTRKIGLFGLLLCLVWGSVKDAGAQTYQQQQRQLLIYNVGLNALIGGIGGVINKKKGEEWHQAFLKNLGFGALGGAIKHHAKYETFHIKDGGRKGYAYLNRMYYYLGHSIVNNASLNNKVYESYSFQLFLANIELSWHRQKFLIKPKLSLTTLLQTGRFVFTGHKINAKRSLKYGLFYFDRGKWVEELIAFGGSNLIAVHHDYQNRYFNPSVIISHEFVHAYQYPDHFLIGNFTNTSFDRLRKNKVYKALDRFVYWDVNLFSPSYWAQLKLFGEPRHFNNFYEFEAHSYATRTYIRR